MSSQQYPARRKKSASERRAQQVRANARVLGRIMNTCVSLLEHRGCEPTAAHTAIVDALSRSHQSSLHKTIDSPSNCASQHGNTLNADQVPGTDEVCSAKEDEVVDNITGVQVVQPNIVPAIGQPDVVSYNPMSSPLLSAQQAIEEYS